MHTGIGLVRLTQRGLLNASKEGLFSPTSGGIFGYHSYDKIKTNIIGFPISTKILWKPLNYFATGIELYVNLNKTNTFFGINLCNQFFNLKNAKRKKKVL